MLAGWYIEVVLSLFFTGILPDFVRSRCGPPTSPGSTTTRLDSLPTATDCYGFARWRMSRNSWRTLMPMPQPTLWRQLPRRPVAVKPRRRRRRPCEPSWLGGREKSSFKSWKIHFPLQTGSPSRYRGGDLGVVQYGTDDLEATGVRCQKSADPQRSGATHLVANKVWGSPTQV